MSHSSWSNDTPRRVIIVEGTAYSGLFFYSSIPGRGNLVGSWTAQSGTDPYGNNYVAGIATYYADGRVALNLGYPAGGGQALELLADSANPIPAQITLATNWQNSRQPFMQALNDGGTIADRLVANIAAAGWISDPIVAFSPGSGGAESWHAPTLGSGWATGPASGTVKPIRYRLTNEGYVFLNGSFHTTSTTPSAVIFTLPSGYFDNTADQRFPVVVDASGTLSVNSLRIFFQTGSVELMTSLTTASTDVYVSAMFPIS